MTKLIYPDTLPEPDSELIKYDTYRVTELVKQLDGTTALFKWTPQTGKLEWEFSNYRDIFDMDIIVDDEPFRYMLDHLIDISDKKLYLSVTERNKLVKYYTTFGYTLHGYKYGGLMSSRCGLVVLDESGHIIRQKLIWMS